MQSKIKLALVYGSAREGRFLDTIAEWLLLELRNHPEFEISIIDPAVVAPPAWHIREDTGERRALQQRIDAADAFLVLTPEYNHGYPAALKHLIDAVYDEWQAKPVGFVSYGGLAGGSRAVEQLRIVFAEVHAVTIRDTVMLPNAWTLFDSSGQMIAPEKPNKSLRLVLQRLHWWATALRTARQLTPYNRVAA